jgi:hypothetical protein
MKHLTRIVTYMGYPPTWLDDPLTILYGGSRTVTAPPKVRLYAVRKVGYDDSMTPLYAQPYPFDKGYMNLQELIKDKKITPLLQDAPILDLDNHLKVFTQ